MIALALEVLGYSRATKLKDRKLLSDVSMMRDENASISSIPPSKVFLKWIPLPFGFFKFYGLQTYLAEYVVCNNSVLI